MGVWIVEDLAILRLDGEEPLDPFKVDVAKGRLIAGPERAQINITPEVKF
jgi:hypothetical protein